MGNIVNNTDKHGMASDGWTYHGDPFLRYTNVA